ncbi:hypothetical protein [Natronocalculus amylovorans]|uniref:Uncharacterized protein n=1 Tax=Natronocalculus amylovorans TaxID=2917812 RepID=A0AAE3FUZ7_9EURY|nr:hypothetical protein [Natronocalculus amylovorans]MCL9815640.1 hypothetical protein [Natronocalculus amylovorans]
MERETVSHQGSGVQIEIRETPYKQHMEYPLVEVTWWSSIEDCTTLVFAETDPARRQLEPAGVLLGGVPTAVVTALEKSGYQIAS